MFGDKLNPERENKASKTGRSYKLPPPKQKYSIFHCNHNMNVKFKYKQYEVITL